MFRDSSDKLPPVLAAVFLSFHSVSAAAAAVIGLVVIAVVVVTATVVSSCSRVIVIKKFKTVPGRKLLSLRLDRGH